MRLELAVLVACLTLTSCASTPPNKTALSCSKSVLKIDNNRIWVNKTDGGSPTIVFEAGFGNDSSVWTSVSKRVQKLGFQTFVYDRAGMGKSEIDTTSAYSIENDAHILITALDRCEISGPAIFVGHSYGGGVGLIAAHLDSRIKALVLLDALVPKVFSQGELEKNLKMMNSDVPEILEKEPKLAKVAIPWMSALPATVQSIDNVAVSNTLPIIDIVATKGQNGPESMKIWRSAHQEFTGKSAHREYILTESSHNVIKDQPDLVVDSIIKINKLLEH